MTSKILILADQKARRLSHQKSLEKMRPDSEFILAKSFQQALDVLEKEKISLIVLDPDIDDSPNKRMRGEAILELKQKSHNSPIVAIGTEREHALKSMMDGADGFIPMGWLIAKES